MSIELNATFYNLPGRDQVIAWRDRTPENFRFFPKITQSISHMRLTTHKAFIRYVGANHPQGDRERLDDWIIRLKSWVDLGIRDIYFFVHQNLEMESPFLSAYFIEKLNHQLGLSLQIPQLLNSERKLF